jgi:hypothetical protein
MEYPQINAADLVQALTEQRDAAMNNAAQLKALLDAALKRERERNNAKSPAPDNTDRYLDENGALSDRA